MTRDQLPFSPEDQLILATLRLDASRERAMREVLQQPIDWSALQHQAFKHSVLPLVYTRLAETVPDRVPPEALEQLHDLYNMNSRRVLVLTADLLKVVHLLEEHDVPVIPLKGLALAEIAYGDAVARSFVDLDILISPSDNAQAQQLLLAAGILCDTHEPTPLPAARLDQKMKRHKNFRVSQRTTRIELLWQLGSYCHPDALPGRGVFPAK